MTHLMEGTNQFSYMNNNNTQTVATLSQLLEIPFLEILRESFVCFKIKRLKETKKKEKKKKVD